MSAAFVISTNADLIKGSVSESLHHWCPRSSLQATASGQFRSSLAFTTTTRCLRDKADLRSSYHRPELGSSRAERDCSSTGGRADMRDGTNLKACCGAAFMTDNSAVGAPGGA